MSIRLRVCEIYVFLRETWYVEDSLNRWNLLLNMSVANFLRTLLHSAVADIFNTLGGICGENLLNRNRFFGDDFHITCIRLQKILLQTCSLKYRFQALENVNRAMPGPPVNLLDWVRNNFHTHAWMITPQYTYLWDPTWNTSNRHALHVETCSACQR